MSESALSSFTRGMQEFFTVQDRGRECRVSFYDEGKEAIVLVLHGSYKRTVACWQGRENPSVDRPYTAVFVANHGVAARGVSAYPAEVTKQMLANFIAGGAAINQICGMLDADLRVYEMAGNAATAEVVLPVPLLEAYEVNLMEERIEGDQVMVEENQVTVPVGPYEIKTLCMRYAKRFAGALPGGWQGMEQDA